MDQSKSKQWRLNLEAGVCAEVGMVDDFCQGSGKKGEEIETSER